MPGCAVANCNHSKRGRLDGSLLFHRFPHEQHRRREWVQRCCRLDKFNPDSCRICSAHFLPSDYDSDSGRRILKRDAIPSVSLLHPNRFSIKSVTSSDRRNERARHSETARDTETAQDMSACTSVRFNFPNSLPLSASSQEPRSCPSSLDNDSLSNPTLISGAHPHSSSSSSQTQMLISDLRKQLADLQKYNSVLQAKLTSLEKFRKNILDKFQPLLSNRQIEAIGENLKITRWDDKEILSALQIRYFSFRAYNILQSTLPLPSISTLKRWVGKVECQPGYQDFLFDILKVKSINFDNFGKLCVISFDEMEISKRICLDPVTGNICGPYSKVQVVLLRGLCSKWKQPIFFDFNFRFNKVLFVALLEKIQNVHLFPIAVVCDFSPTNRALLKELEITYEHPWIKLQNLNHPVFFFCRFSTYAQAPSKSFL